jgi:hypothetical protein
MNDQLDLFADSRGTELANAVIAALAARDAAAAAAAVADLRRHDPGNAHLPGLTSLAEAVSGWRTPPADRDAIVGCVERLDAEIAPTARRELGAGAEAFATTFFRELADVALALPYLPTHPAASRAFLCLRCGDWAGAEQAALAMPQASTTPDALLWLAIARYRQHGLAAARRALFALAWHAPHRFDAARAELHDELLDRDWRRFVAACEWNEIRDGELPAWFPAWYLIEYPAVAADLDYFDAPSSGAAETARLLNHIFGLETRGDWRQLARERDKLRRRNADLFALYMARRSVQHR